MKGLFSVEILLGRCCAVELDVKKVGILLCTEENVMLSFHVTSRLHGYISTPNPAFTLIGLAIRLGRDKMLGTSGGGPPTPELPSSISRLEARGREGALPLRVNPGTSRSAANKSPRHAILQDRTSSPLPRDPTCTGSAPHQPSHQGPPSDRGPTRHREQGYIFLPSPFLDCFRYNISSR